jgi:hypothetical protein
MLIDEARRPMNELWRKYILARKVNEIHFRFCPCGFICNFFRCSLLSCWLSYTSPSILPDSPYNWIVLLSVWRMRCYMALWCNGEHSVCWSQRSRFKSVPSLWMLWTRIYCRFGMAFALKSILKCLHIYNDYLWTTYSFLMVFLLISY